MARNFSRGAPPPPGSIEYIAVGDMWDPEIYARKARAAGVGFAVYEISFTDLDASNNYIEAIDRSVKQARKVHGDKLLSRADEREWDDFYQKWRVFVADMRMVPGGPSMMLKENKSLFDQLVSRARTLHDRFHRAGASEVPVPYAGELLVLLRNMPKRLTSTEMQAKLLAGAKCGERMLDTNTTWFDWVASRDHLPLKASVKAAIDAADIYGRSRSSKQTYSAGDPVYDEFLRRLSKIWIEAAGLYGIQQTRASATAAFKDDARKMPESAGRYALGLLALAGVAYLGTKWVLSGPDRSVVGVVAVPDAYTNEGEP
jgi:hypothetical protein